MKFDPSPFSSAGSTHLKSENSSASPLTAPMPSRRRILKSLCACCAGFAIAPAGLSLLAAADRAEAATAQGTIRVGHLPAGCVSHLLLAKARGMFEKAGINAQLTQFNGPDKNILALQSGNVDVAHNPWTTTIAAYADNSKNLRIVGGSGLAGIELVARAGSVKNVIELVAYGTMAMHGKKYDDYAMQFFPSMVGMGEAIASSAVDVCSLAQPYAESVVAQNNAVYLANSNDVWGPAAPDCVINSTDAFIAKNGELLTAYQRVLVAAAKDFYGDFDAAIKDLQPSYGAPKEILAVALRRQAPNPVIGDAGAAGIRNGVKYLIDLGYLKTNVTDEVLDLKFQPA